MSVFSRLAIFNGMPASSSGYLGLSLQSGEFISQLLNITPGSLNGPVPPLNAVFPTHYPFVAGDGISSVSLQPGGGAVFQYDPTGDLNGMVFLAVIMKAS
jgi:hypothetical protein